MAAYFHCIWVVSVSFLHIKIEGKKKKDEENPEVQQVHKRKQSYKHGRTDHSQIRPRFTQSQP